MTSRAIYILEGGPAISCCPEIRQCLNAGRSVRRDMTRTWPAHRLSLFVLLVRIGVVARADLSLVDCYKVAGATCALSARTVPLLSRHLQPRFAFSLGGWMYWLYACIPIPGTKTTRFIRFFS